MSYPSQSYAISNSSHQDTPSQPSQIIINCIPGKLGKGEGMQSRSIPCPSSVPPITNQQNFHRSPLGAPKLSYWHSSLRAIFINKSCNLIVSTQFHPRNPESSSKSAQYRHKHSEIHTHTSNSLRLWSMSTPLITKPKHLWQSNPLCRPPRMCETKHKLGVHKTPSPELGFQFTFCTGLRISRSQTRRRTMMAIVGEIGAEETRRAVGREAGRLSKWAGVREERRKRHSHFPKRKEKGRDSESGRGHRYQRSFLFACFDQKKKKKEGEHYVDEANVESSSWWIRELEARAS